MGAALAVALILPAVITLGEDYILEDAEMSGQEIHAFEDGGETVSVIVGRFRLSLGGWTLTGRDAVVWVRQESDGPAVRRDITAYVEGDAQIVEPSGTTTSDRVMLVTMRHQGRLTADGRMANGSLRDFPLYNRAVAVRAADRQRAIALAQAPRSAATAEAKARSADQKPTTGEAEAPVTPQAVAFRSDSFSSEIRGDRRFTVARGNVYMSQGNPESNLFLELSSQAAVIISQKRPPKEARVPWAQSTEGIDTALPGAEGLTESIVGAYLEGDVVIRRGDRMMRGPIAYYDFTNDRALVLDPVFRTVQQQRNVPIYIRAREARTLSAREIWFKDAKISTSDFYSPSYHIGAKTAYLMDTTPYDEKQVRLGEQSMRARIRHGTFNVRSMPMLYTPYSEMDLQQGHTALRTASVGSHGQLGIGAETEWHLFRMLGLLRPKGFKGRVELNWYERGPMVGARLWYDRDTFSGYSLAYGIVDSENEDDFGDDRENIEAPDNRGRILIRHKHLLPRDWQVQLELSYLCDRNYLEQFHPAEFFGGKEQETLIYAKKQRDNWAITSLLQYRLNRFLTQTESMPDMGFYLIGQPLLSDRLTLFSESHAGFKRYRTDKANQATLGPDSDIFLRLDTRNEIDMPLKLGPVNLVAYATGRLTYWDDAPSGGVKCRPYGQLGVRANMHIWRLYNNVESRIWDIHRLKHIITPEVVAFVNSNEVSPSELFPMDPDIEVHLRRQGGVAVGIHQRLQTKRGPVDDRRTVDWMRLNIVAGFYANGADTTPADGRFFSYRPEYSIGRNHINADYTWHISDSTTLLADANHDLNTGRLRRANVGFAVSRDPRLGYYVGVRYIRDLDSAIGVFGFRYKINRKYSVTFFEQYDMDFDGGRNMATSISIVRKLPRWYAAFTFAYNTTYNDVTLYLSLWPEGVPEVTVGSGRMSLLGESDMN